MTDWLTIRKDPIEAVEHGVAESPATFAHQHLGPVAFDRMDYPAAEVLPDSTERADATNWDHDILVNLYFERGRELDYVADILHPVAGTIECVLTALGDVPRATNYYPVTVNDYAGELDNTSLLLVMIRFRITTQVDPGTF